ncbi:hypothetical protein CYY_001904 [Polysphondylium violaceum]|uniref:Large ribosomal subunit protein uL23m n=1 Tax=Polysphondylium violaceum TaxID=133409 RepID=A0A8J4Q128_9MYCE|nr:hypothetical protein CYY_001904 [Polysphondylium violaceum]
MSTNKVIQASSKYWNNIFFPNIKLTVFRNTHETFEKTNKLMFKTNCNVGKIDIKNYVKALYDVDVSKVNTINVQGRIKTPHSGIGSRMKRFRNKFKATDYKKAIITVDDKFVETLKRK